MTRKIAFGLFSALLAGTLSAAHAQEPAQAAAPGSTFYKIGIQHYDAGMMADLATRQDAIVVIPPNFVIPDGGFAPALSGGPSVTTLGAPGGRPLPNTAPNAAPAPAPAANNRLPDGVERIYALRSDNSLVIQVKPGTQFSPFTNPFYNPPIR